MRNRITTLLLLTGLCLAGAGTAASASSILTADLTLRVAPSGFVAPSLHWSTSYVAGESTPAVWVVDPAQNQQLNDEEGIAGCDLTVDDANGDDRVDGGEVLDHAVDQGCIVSWDSQYYEGLGRSVVEVDGLEKQGWPASWWQIQVDGHISDVGIDGLDLQDGQDLSFVYYVGP